MFYQITFHMSGLSNLQVAFASRHQVPSRSYNRMEAWAVLSTTLHQVLHVFTFVLAFSLLLIKGYLSFTIHCKYTAKF